MSNSPSSILHPPSSYFSSPLDRRQFLFNTGGGLGGIAAAYLFAHDHALAAPRANLNGGLHHRAKVKRVIQLFMNGGASPMDLFDHKPRLSELHGHLFDPGPKALVDPVPSTPGHV